jgi:hypothetical protein
MRKNMSNEFEKTATFLNFYDENEQPLHKLRVDKIMSRFQEHLEGNGQLFIDNYLDTSSIHKFVGGSFQEPEHLATEDMNNEELQELEGDQREKLLSAARTSSFFDMDDLFVKGAENNLDLDDG